MRNSSITMRCIWTLIFTLLNSRTCRAQKFAEWTPQGLALFGTLIAAVSIVIIICAVYQIYKRVYKKRRTGSFHVTGQSDPEVGGWENSPPRLGDGRLAPPMDPDTGEPVRFVTGGHSRLPAYEETDRNTMFSPPQYDEAPTGDGQGGGWMVGPWETTDAPPIYPGQELTGNLSLSLPKKTRHREEDKFSTGSSSSIVGSSKTRSKPGSIKSQTSRKRPVSTNERRPRLTQITRSDSGAGPSGRPQRERSMLKNQPQMTRKSFERQPNLVKRSQSDCGEGLGRRPKIDRPTLKRKSAEACATSKQPQMTRRKSFERQPNLAKRSQSDYQIRSEIRNSRLQRVPTGLQLPNQIQLYPEMKPRNKRPIVQRRSGIKTARTANRRYSVPALQRRHSLQ